MSEYWKSTPKYWCKFCKDYIKDTKFERQQHEATGRHQSNIQRSLKGLHREQQNAARQQQRAKDEVARLNGLVPSTSAAAEGANAPVKPTFAKTEEKKATLQDRKKQWEQLAAMGIAVPDEAKGGMALKGEWTVVKEEVVGEINEEGEFRALNKGVRKRKVDEEELERELAGETITKKKGWGQTYKSLPGRGDDDEDIEALFKRRKTEDKEEDDGVKKEVKDEEGVKGEDEPESMRDIPTADEDAARKAGSSAAATVKKEKEADTPAPTVVFKKRKKIAK
ncbi:U1 zinc finger domain-containing protein [Bimuria novae-zelandiae CBS 107.79]|uniref:U1 zinc finger domain-containing protein n=1 Tax=Bimuria novae-zelandiae CBS 107.79 TaxID=1447943 RepID=A0A6A5UU75_9PLEO|nr:U1 zinc finger domain-containing protein [Bimuria novae-zelandiae CBS 107.79]